MLWHSVFFSAWVFTPRLSIHMQPMFPFTNFTKSSDPLYAFSLHIGKHIYEHVTSV